MGDYPPFADHQTRQALITIFREAGAALNRFGHDFDHENDGRGLFVGKIREAAEEADLPVRITTYGPEEAETGADIGVVLHRGEDVKGFMAQIKRDDERRPLHQGVAELKKRRGADGRSQLGLLRECQDGSAVLIFGPDGPRAVRVSDLPSAPLTTRHLHRAATDVASLVDDFVDCKFGRRGWDTVSKLLYEEDALRRQHPRVKDVIQIGDPRVTHGSPFGGRRLG